MYSQVEIQMKTLKSWLIFKCKIHNPFKWIQLIERSYYLNMNSCLHLPNKLKECGKFCETCSNLARECEISDDNRKKIG